jgi:molybdopterin/thiamine biosynthesis adenylyltransferase
MRARLERRHARDTRWDRLAGVIDVDALRDRHVVVVGVGSGGSTVALELAKAGVARFTLIDPDEIEETNLIRHECDDRYVGWNKAEAVADLVRHRNPRAHVDAIAADAFDPVVGIGSVVHDAALVAACTDGEGAKHRINRLCLEHRVPAVYGGVYEGGVGGEIVRVHPGDACYACVTTVLKEAAPVPGADGELDYGLIDADGILHGAPGLGLDVRLVAALHAKVTLLTLLTDARDTADDVVDVPANAVLFGTVPVDGLFPRHFTTVLMDVAPQTGCLVCAPYRASVH